MTTIESLSAPACEARTTAAGHRVAVLGGKGGVGKTNVAVNLAVAASGLGARVLLVDGDLGLANVDVLLGLTPRRTIAELIDGECSLHELILEGPSGVDIVPAASARMDLAASGPVQLMRLLEPLAGVGRRYDLVLVDVGAGLAATGLGLAASCDRALLVTTPEPTSVTDAYATWKVTRGLLPELPIELVVNTARDELHARATHDHLERVGARFLGQRIPMRAFLSSDPLLPAAVAEQRAVVEAYPAAPISRQLIALARGLLEAGRTTPAREPAERTWRRVPS